MAKVGDQAHTPHGLGKITEVLTERGGKSFRVAGRGFNVWVDETKLHVANESLMSFGPMMHEQEEWQSPEHQELMMLSGLETTINPGGDYNVNEKNHTTLPYDYSPQYPVDLFSQEQTILPGDYKIDPDKRLRPSDSVSGKSRSAPSGPQPSGDLFLPNSDHPFADQRTSALHHYAGEHEKPYAMGWQSEGPHAHEAPAPVEHHAPPTHQVGMGDEEYNSYLGDDPGSAGGLHETWPMPKGEGGPGHYPSGGDFYRPAGLDGRYAYVPVEADNDSPVAQFRRDPVNFIRTCGHLWTDGDDSLEKFAEYTNLLDHDPQMREAAWRDVAQKASRLRHDGKVAVHDIGHNRIFATVEGDHGTYDVMLSKSGALGNTQSVADWTCSCDWGRWAFKRTMTYIGRLCSHAYAAYQEMQSRYLKENPGHFAPKSAASTDDYKSWLGDNGQAPEAASVANYLNTQGNDATGEDVNKMYDYISDNPDEVPERDFKAPYTNDPDEAYKTADLLRQVPQSLTPNLRDVGEGEDEKWMDVTKDERDTTSPDQIMHFSSADAMRYLHADMGGGVTDFASSSGVGGNTAPITPPAPTPTPDAGATPDAGTGGATMPDASAPTTTPPSTNSLDDPAAGNYLGSRRFAETSDEGLLNKLRTMSSEPVDDYGHMDSHNDELRDVVDELQDRGYDASFMVAAIETPADGDANFLGQSSPNWADKGFAGSGPNPKDWISDSAGYVEENEVPHHETDWFDGDGDIIKFNDSRSKPQQGPRQGHRTADVFSPGSGVVTGDTGGMTNQTSPGLGGGDLSTPDESFDPNVALASLHSATGGGMDDEVYSTSDMPTNNLGGAGDYTNTPASGMGMGDFAGGGGLGGNDVVTAAMDEGYFNPNNADDSDWQAGSGEDFANDAGQQVQDAAGQMPQMPGGGGGGGAPGEGAAAGEAGGAGAAAEIPLVVASQGFDPAAAFDRGEFLPEAQLRRANRAGHGPTAQVRVDPGARGWQKQAASGQQPPEDFGFEGGRELEAYLTEDQGDPSGMDILAAFHGSGAAAAINADSAPQPGSSDDFASSPMVQAMLRTAGRQFSPEEQRELEAEYHPQGARNMPTADDLAGTHYAL